MAKLDDLFQSYNQEPIESSNISNIDQIENPPQNQMPKQNKLDQLFNTMSSEVKAPVQESDGRTFLEGAKDVGLMAAEGVVGAGEGIVGLADIPTLGHAGKFLEDKVGIDFEGMHGSLREHYSDAQKAANQKLTEADGFVDTAKTALQNPSTIIKGVVESLPSMAAGGLIGKGLLKAGAVAKPFLAAAAGEGIMQAGSMAEGVRQQDEGGLITSGQAAQSIGSGIGTGVFGALGGRLAKELGLNDIDELFVTGELAARSGKGVIARILGGGITEGVFEELPQSMQETIWMNAATGRELTEGIGHAAAMGILTGAAMGGAGNIAGRRGQNDPRSEVDQRFDRIKAQGPEQVAQSIEALDQKIVDDAELLNDPEALEEAAVSANLPIEEFVVQLQDENAVNQELRDKLQNEVTGQETEVIEAQDSEDVTAEPINEETRLLDAPDTAVNTQHVQKVMDAVEPGMQYEGTNDAGQHVFITADGTVVGSNSMSVAELGPKLEAARQGKLNTETPIDQTTTQSADETSSFNNEQQVEQPQIEKEKIINEVRQLNQEAYDLERKGQDAGAIYNQINEIESKHPELKAQFQIGNNQFTATPVNLKTIQNTFPNQQVSQAEDGKVSIQFKNGKGLTIQNIQQADDGFIKMAIDTGQMKDGQTIRGITQGTEILLDENFADNATLWHENKHVLDNLGMITAKDNAALNKEFNKLRKKDGLEFALSTHEDSKQRMVENRANMLAQIMVNREAYRNTPFGKTIQRIMDFFNQLLAFGKQSVSGLAREFESGKIYERTVNGKTMQTTVPQFEQTAKQWYSTLVNAVDGFKQKQATPDQWKGMIGRYVKNKNGELVWKGYPGIKPEEIEWMGLNEWLDEQKGKVSKEDLMEFVQENNVQLEEVMYPGQKTISPLAAQETKQLENKIAVIEKKKIALILQIQEYVSQQSSYNLILQADQTFVLQDRAGQISELFDTPYLDRSLAKNINGVEFQLSKYGTEIEELKDKIDDLSLEYQENPRHADYQLPGGKNYKELVLTLPRKQTSMNQDAQAMFGKDFSDLTVDEIEWYRAQQDDPTKDYTHGHWQDITNPLAHVRFNERTDSEGNKVLFLEEVQSDWHQEGRKQGYGDQIDIRKDQNGFYRAYDVNNNPIELRVDGEVYSALVTEQDVRNALPDSFAAKGVPDAPFKKTWPLLTMKRMVRYAAENGFDKIAWPSTPEQVAQIEGWGVITEKQTDKGTSYFVHGDKNVTSIVNRYLQDIPRMVNKEFNRGKWGKGKVEVIDSNILEDVRISKEEALKAFDEGKEVYIGPEIAISRDEIINHPYDNDLAIDGEYNDTTITVPKKFLALPITDRMKSKALREGMPQFQVGERQNQEVISWTPERLSWELSYGAYPDGRTKSMVAWVNPQDFINATTFTEDHRQRIKDSAGDLNINKLREENQTPYLQIKDGKITGHEGRHRMSALADAGYTSIPVVLDYRQAEMREDSSNINLKGQSFYNYDTDSDSNLGKDIAVKNAIPITYANKKRIQEVMDSSSDVHFAPNKISDNTANKYTGPRYETDMKDILYLTRKNTQTKNQKQMIDFLSMIIPKNKLKNTKVIIEPRVGSPNYDSITNTITLKDPLDIVNSNHEVTHAVTVNELARHREIIAAADAAIAAGKPVNNPKQVQASRKIVKQLDRIFAYAKQLALKNEFFTEETLQQLEQMSAKEFNANMVHNNIPVDAIKGNANLAYAFLNEKEFLAQAIGNPDVQRSLKQMKMPSNNSFKNAWDAFVDMLMKALGVKDVSNTVFGKALSSVAELAQTELNESVKAINQFAQDDAMSIVAAENKIQNNPVFKKWFGNSKVVDQDGNPLVMYHGSRYNFNAFKDQLRKLFSFSTSTNLASSFATDKGQVYPVYINAQNPFDFRNPKHVDQFIQALKDNPEHDGFVRNWPQKDKNFDMVRKSIEAGNWNDIENVPILKMLGFDGAWTQNSFDRENMQLHVFEPNQIKSIYNQGTWDGTNSDIAYAPAYQGSPTRGIKKMSTDYIGKGEGGGKQAYVGAKGWGMYFTDSKDIAEWYRKTLSDPESEYERFHIIVDGVDSGQIFNSMGDDWTHLQLQEANGNADQAIAKINKYISRGASPNVWQNALEDLEKFRGKKVDYKKLESSQGQLYKVEIPEANELMHWDKPLSEQPDITRSKLGEIRRKLGKRFIEKIEDTLNADMKDWTGKELYSALAHYAEEEPLLTGPQSAEEYYNYLEEKYAESGAYSLTDVITDTEWKKLASLENISEKPTAQLASEYLASIGIKGHSFPADQGRRESVSNYVIYEDSAVDITGTYYAPGEMVDQKLTDAQYDRRFNEKNNIVQDLIQNTRMKLSEMKLLADKSLGSISTRLRNINPMIMYKMRDLDFRTSQKIIAALRTAKPLLEATKRMSKKDKHTWDQARKEADTGKVQQLAQKYGLTENVEELRDVLNIIREEAQDVGYDVGFIDEYWPRVIKDREGFLQATQEISHDPVFTNAIKDQADKMGISVEKFEANYPDAKADIISNLILGRNLGIGGPGNIQARKFETIPDKYVKYYMDSDAALMQYIYSMTKKIEARRFFGKVPERIRKIKNQKRRYQIELDKLMPMAEAARVDNDGESLTTYEDRISKLTDYMQQADQKLEDYKHQERDYTENIGAYIDELRMAENINPGKGIKEKDEKILRDILDARFHEQGTTGVINAYKNLAYIDTMGSPISAFTQIGDLAWAMYVGKVWTPKGFSNTIKNMTRALFNKSKVTKEDLGIERIAQEFADGTTLSKAVNKVFWAVGLTKIDSIGKETLINNALDQYKAQVSTEAGRAQLMQKIRPIFGAQSNQVVQDILAGTASDNVKMLLYSRLLDFQPVALSEMPEQYLKGGNGRVFYMLKTYTLKQFDVFRNEAWRNMKEGAKNNDPKQIATGIKNMTQLMILLTLANAGADEVKDFALGKETKFKDHVIENFLTMGGASRYTRMQVTREGIGSAVAQQILPPFKFINAFSKDVSGNVEDGLRTVESIPVGGKLYYWHAGRGAGTRKTENEKEFSKVGKDVRKFKKSFDDAEDKRVFIRSNPDDFKQMKIHQKFQTSLNKNQAVINKLEDLPQTTNVVTRLGQLNAQREKILDSFFKIQERIGLN